MADSLRRRLDEVNDILYFSRVSIFVSLVFKELKMRESENWLEGYVNDNLLTGRLLKGYYNLATRQLEKGIEFLAAILSSMILYFTANEAKS